MSPSAGSGQAEELAGALRQRVTIEARDPARDALGGADGTWTAVASAWAAIVPEAAVVGEAGAAGARPRWRVVLRSEAAVTLDQRLSWGARHLRVRGITADPTLPDRIVLSTEEER